MALGASNIQKMTAQMTDNQTHQARVIDDMGTEMDQLEDVNGNIAKTAEETAGLFDSAASDQTQIDALNREIQATNDKRNEDVGAISDQAVLDEEEALKDKQTKIHLKKFVDESGMCGMGMGMGNTYSECGAIDLTAEELMALKDELLDLGDSQEKFDSNFDKVTDALNDKLKESGSSCSTGKDEDGGTFLEIKRSDGSSVKIYDANGNGALDNKDYDFCQAIQQAQEIITKMNEKIQAIHTKAQADIDAVNKAADDHIAELQAQIEALEGTRDTSLAKAEHNNKSVMPQLNEEAEGIQDKYDASKTDLEQTNDNIDKLQGQIDEAQAAEDAQAAANAEEPEAPVEKAPVAEEAPVVAEADPEAEKLEEKEPEIV